MTVLRAGRGRYHQLAELVRARIADGTYPPGAKLPTELALMQEHGLGRNTVRLAMAELRREGLVDVIQGRGTIVREQESLQPLTAARGSKVRSRPPRPDEVDEWDLPEGVSMLVIIDPAGRERGAWPGHLFEVPIK